MGTNGYSPEDIQALLSDEDTYKTWVVQQLVAIGKRLDNLEKTNKMYQSLLFTILTVVLGLIGLLISHMIGT